MLAARAVLADTWACTRHDALLNSLGGWVWSSNSKSCEQSRDEEGGAHIEGVSEESWEAREA